MDILPSRINHNQVGESAAALTRCSEEGGGRERRGPAGSEYVIVIRYGLALHGSRIMAGCVVCAP